MWSGVVRREVIRRWSEGRSGAEGLGLGLVAMLAERSGVLAEAEPHSAVDSAVDIVRVASFLCLGYSKSMSEGAIRREGKEREKELFGTVSQCQDKSCRFRKLQYARDQGFGPPTPTSQSWA